jgi:hypothetical protein
VKPVTKFFGAFLATCTRSFTLYKRLSVRPMDALLAISSGGVPWLGLTVPIHLQAVRTMASSSSRVRAAWLPRLLFMLAPNALDRVEVRRVARQEDDGQPVSAGTGEGAHPRAAVGGTVDLRARCRGVPGRPRRSSPVPGVRLSPHRALHVPWPLVSRLVRLPGPGSTGSVWCSRGSGSASRRRWTRR